MPDYDNTNRGALFINTKKEKESQPDYTGNLNVDGTDFQMSGWKKESKNGHKYLSIAVQPKKDWVKTETREKFTKEEVVLDDIGDEPVDLSDIPF